MTSHQIPADVQQKVRTVTEAGAPVKERISSILAARKVYDDFKSGSTDESMRRARLKGHIDGNQPFDQAELEELGMGNRTNVNFLEMRAILDTRAGSHHELFAEVPTLITANLYKIDPKDQNQVTRAAEWGHIVAEEFSTAMTEWSGFFVNMDKARREADAYGVGIQAWLDEYDFRAQAFDTGNVLFDPKAKLDLEKIQVVFFRDEIPLSSVVNHFRTPEATEAAKLAGWKVEKLRDVLVAEFGPSATVDKNSEATMEAQKSPWEAVQDRIRTNDTMVQASEFKGLEGVHMLVRELDGAISHYIFTDSSSVANVSGSADDFLFKKTSRFQKMAQALWWLPYNYGDGRVRSVRGCASYLEPHCDLSNRFLGQTFDAGFTAASLLLQPKSAVDMSALQLIRMGPYTIIPPELEAVQSSFAPSFQHLISLRAMSSDVMKNNAGVNRSHPEIYGENQPEKTAREVVETSAREQRVEKANITNDYVMFDAFYRETFRRIVNPAYIESSAALPGQDEAKAFVERCERRGVPRDILLDASAWKISATRAIGFGSTGVKLDVTNQLQQPAIRAQMDEVGKVEAFREYLGVRVGYRNVDRFRPRLNRDEIPSNATVMANLENNDFIEGKALPVGSDQLHKIHVIQHAEFIVKVQAGIEQGQMDNRVAYGALSTVIPHVAKHLDYLKVDPAYADIVDAADEMLKKAVKQAKELEAAILQEEKQARAQQEAQEDEIRVLVDNAKRQQQSAEALEVQRKYELEMTKQNSLNQAREQKTAEQLEIKRQGMAADLVLRKEKQDAEIALAREKASKGD